MKSKTTISNLPQIFCNFGSPVRNRSLLFGAFLYSLFSAAKAQCSNNFTFPYFLKGAGKAVGSCISLQLPSTTPNVSIPVILSFMSTFKNMTENMLHNCPNIIPYDPNDCCLIQVYDQFLEFCGGQVVLWRLRVSAELGYQIDPTELEQFENQARCPQESNQYIVPIIFLTLSLILLCGLLILAFKGLVQRPNVRNIESATEMTALVNNKITDAKEQAESKSLNY